MRKWMCLAIVAGFLFSTAHGLEFGGGAFSAGKAEVVVSAQQRWARLKHKDGSVSKTTYDPTAGAVGIKFGAEQFTTGLSVSYEGGTAKHDSSYIDRGNPIAVHDKTEDRTLGFTLFGKYRTLSGFNISGSAFLGVNWVKTKSGTVHDQGGPLAVLGSAGSKSSLQYGASLEVGKDFDFGGLRLTPHVGVDYSFTPKSKLRMSVFDGLRRYEQETPFSIPKQNFWEVPVGVTVAKSFVCGDWTIRPSVDLTLVTSIGNIRDNNMNFRAGFSSFNGSAWKVYGLGGDHWGGRVTVGVNALKAGRFDLGVKYSYEGRRSFNDHRLSANLGFSF